MVEQMAAVRKANKSRGVSSLLHRPGQIVSRAKAWYSLEKKGTIGFAIENVAGFGISTPRISEYTMSLYKDVLLLEKALGSTRYSRSLEIGCGYGRITPWIAKYSKKHHAVEPEPKLLEMATKLYPSVRFHKGVAQDLPFPDNFFDLIVSFSVLHHIPPEKISDVVQEIKRMAQPTATILLHERVKGKEGYKQRSWIHDYKKMFSPWKLKLSLDRNAPGLGRDPFTETKLMLFKGVAKGK